MVDSPSARLWLYQGLYLALAVLIMAVLVLPLPRNPDSLPGPDLMLCLTLAWAIRRPDFLPALLIALVFLLQDFLLSRPPGVWAMLVVVITEFLRGRWALTRELNFPTEWLLMAGLMLAALMVNRLILTIVLVPVPGLGPTLVQILWSVLVYPVVVWAIQNLFGLRKPATGETDAFGRQL